MNPAPHPSFSLSMPCGIRPFFYTYSHITRFEMTILFFLLYTFVTRPHSSYVQIQVPHTEHTHHISPLSLLNSTHTTQEICWSYIGTVMNDAHQVVARRALLLRRWGFECRCMLCTEQLRDVREGSESILTV